MKELLLSIKEKNIKKNAAVFNIYLTCKTCKLSNLVVNMLNRIILNYSDVAYIKVVIFHRLHLTNPCSAAIALWTSHNMQIWRKLHFQVTQGQSIPLTNQMLWKSQVLSSQKFQSTITESFPSQSPCLL